MTTTTVQPGTAGRIVIDEALHNQAFANELPHVKRNSKALDGMPCILLRVYENCGVLDVNLGDDKPYSIVPSRGETFVEDQS